MTGGGRSGRRFRTEATKPTLFPATLNVGPDGVSATNLVTNFTRLHGQALCDYVDSGIVLDGRDRPAGCSLRDGSLEVCLRGFKAP
jgi:hypothetical protein